MRLNIHIIIHPIIQKLTYKIIYQKSSKNPENIDNEKILGMLILYEILRKWLKINNIYIKKFNVLQEKYFTNHLNKYLIISNIIENYNILSYIDKILPKNNLTHVDYDKKINLYNCKKELQEHKIIIFEKYIKNYKMIKMIKYLNENNKIKLANIIIVCLTCSNKVLNYIAQKYPKLNIYTTKII
uniref:hypothetical protein n=1 Tax=Gracilaria urvillei TaxID=172974 RepID=UPI001D127A50|nr:hypothetical protein LK147_pgp005 [Hydropuntia urvillei]UAD88535.1 hypothetical protein [Hydropuntia urvillei]